MPNIVFSLDYDGCSSILFEATQRAWLEKISAPKYRVYAATMENILGACKEVLSETLDALHFSHEGIPEIYCGSNRQSRWLDDITKRQGGAPDSALDSLRTYCREKRWSYNSFLLADKYLSKPAGFSIDKPRATSDVNITNFGNKFNEWDPAKTEIIFEQLKKVSEANKGKIVDFFFIDDDGKNKILPGLSAYFSSNPGKLPPNVRLHLIKYDWQVLIEKIRDLFGKTKSECKVLARELVQPQCIIERHDLMGHLARTQTLPGKRIPVAASIIPLAIIPTAQEPSATPTKTQILPGERRPRATSIIPLAIMPAAEQSSAAPKVSAGTMVPTPNEFLAKDKYEVYNWRQYSVIWMLQEQQPPLNKIKALLFNYASGSVFNWGRHYRGIVSSIAKRINNGKENKIGSVEEVINELNKLYLVANHLGCIARHIRFIAYETHTVNLLAQPPLNNAKLAIQWYQHTGSDGDKAMAVLRDIVNRKSILPIWNTNQVLYTAIRQQLLNKRSLSLGAIAEGLANINQTLPLTKELSQWQTYFNSIARLGNNGPQIPGAYKP